MKKRKLINTAESEPNTKGSATVAANKISGAQQTISATKTQHFSDSRKADMKKMEFEADSLISDNSTKWVIEDQCSKIKKSLDEGSALGKSLVEICKSINENLQFASIQVTDPTILKQYMRRMPQKCWT